MKIRKASKSLIFILLLTLGACSEVNPPSETLDEYIERSEIERELVELYFYPTTVRMLDKFISSGEGGILEGVEEGRLFYAKYDTLDVLKRDLKDLQKGLESEGFEMLAEFKTGDVKTVAFIRDQSVDRFVLFLGGTDIATMLIEMKGEISMKTIQGMSDLNSDNVMSLLELAGDRESQKEEADSTTTETEPILNDSLQTDSLNSESKTPEI
jgi:hypothetical protein